MTKLQERLQYAKDMDHGFIAEKNGEYVSGAWSDVKHAKECGWTILGFVAEMYKLYEEILSEMCEDVGTENPDEVLKQMASEMAENIVKENK